jgi:hypothetical protein
VLNGNRRKYKNRRIAYIMTEKIWHGGFEKKEKFTFYKSALKSSEKFFYLIVRMMLKIILLKSNMHSLFYISTRGATELD